MGWIPIGPISTRSISIFDGKALSGRIRDIATDASGRRVYLAAANGGVFRSDDGGDHWIATMDNWIADASTAHSSPLACGAVAIDPSNPDRIFAGTGEDTWYGGVGPVRSDSGGLGAVPWVIEPVAAGSPSLAGASFTALAIDPNNVERVVATTSSGVYRREPDGASGFHWVHQTGSATCTDVAVVSSGGVTTFFLTRRGSGSEPAQILTSNDGASWLPLGVGFPSSGVGKVRLAVQPRNANLVYALETNASSTAGALYRIDLPDSQWREVTGLPPIFTGQPPMAVAVDPANTNYVFLGSVPLYRATITSSGSGAALTYTMTPTRVTGIHSDHYALKYSDSARLWFGCDGGAYYTGDAAGAVTIESKNIGLSAMQPNAIGLHPTEDAVLFIGTQDNGTIRYDGDEVWRNLTNMDGGQVLVNWRDPYQILANTAGGGFLKATDGGQGFLSFTSFNIPEAVNFFYPPVEGPPPGPDPAAADLVAVGGTRLWLSNSFGGGWYSVPNGDASDDLPGSDDISGLAFPSPTLIYAATRLGSVYRYERSGTSWSRTVLPSIPSVSWLSEIAVDPSDSSFASLYVAAFNATDYRHVWRYDGTTWEARSGPSPGAPTSLPNLQYQSLAVDPMDGLKLYAGNDTGLWRSTNGGLDWTRFDDNLPRAPIVDLKIHPLRRMLYAVTYGRGVYAYDLASPSPPPVELYIRDHALDLGKRPTVDWLPDPLAPGQYVVHWEGPDIKVDAPTATGSYQLTPPINSFQFVDQLVDMSGGVETIDRMSPPVVNRVYVQVHNRGLSPASGHVMLLVANASTRLPDLPAEYTMYVTGRRTLATPDWNTVDFQPFSNLRVGAPQILQFDLPSTMLPPPAGLPGNNHWCALALVHGGTDDGFTATEVHVDTLTVNDRKATNKNFTIVPAAMPAMGGGGAIGGGGSGSGGRIWVPLRLNGSVEDLGDLVFDLSAFDGEVHVVLPDALAHHLDKDSTRIPTATHVDSRPGGLAKEVERRIADVEALAKGKRFDAKWCDQMVAALSAVRHAPARAMSSSKREHVLLTRPKVATGSWATMFLTFHPHPRVKPGHRFCVTAHHRTKRASGGYTWEIRVSK